MELGTAVAIKQSTAGAAFTYHFAEIDGSTVALVGTDENTSTGTTTTGELVYLYKPTKYVEDIVARAPELLAVDACPAGLFLAVCESRTFSAFATSPSSHLSKQP